MLRHISTGIDWSLQVVKRDTRQVRAPVTLSALFTDICMTPLVAREALNQRLFALPTIQKLAHDSDLLEPKRSAVLLLAIRVRASST